ncbi:MAG: hypothetical protein ACREFJ_03920, partial [Acetobacteraceae bacterium]
FGLDRLSGSPEWFDDPAVAREVGAVLDGLRSAFQSGEPLLAAVRSRLSRKQLLVAAKALGNRVRTSPVTPDLDEEEAIRRLRSIETTERGKIAKMLRQLAREYKLQRDEAHSVELRKHAETVTNGKRERQTRVFVHARRRPNVAKRTPLLLIDADADPGVNSRLFGRPIEHETIKVERNAVVTQCKSSRFSKKKLRKQKALDEIKAVIRRKASEGKTLVVCPLEIRGAITGEITGETEKSVPLSVEWDGVTISHFGRIRGVDDWKDYDTVIILGAEQPPAQAVEGMARAIWSDDPEPLQVPRQYETGVRGYRLRSGERKGVQIRYYLHPDARVQQVLELKREREAVQAIDRLRLVHAEKPKQVIILCNIPLDITVDHLVSRAEIRDEGSRIERAYRQSAGAVPLIPLVVVKRYPDLWKTEKAAEHDIARSFETPQSLIDTYSRHSPDGRPIRPPLRAG